MAKNKRPRRGVRLNAQSAQPRAPAVDNAPYDLPDGWTWEKLASVCTKIQDGTHFSPKTQYPDPGKGRFLYITSKNIREYGLDLTDVTYINKDVHQPIFARCNPEKGDVLLTKDGAKTGVTAINTIDEPFSMLSSVALMKTDRSILLPQFLKYFLDSPSGKGFVTGAMTGTAIKRIILDKIRKSLVPIPPLPEQRRIVAHIESLFAESRTAREALEGVPALFKRFRKSVLASAFRGELTERDLNDEPASALLARLGKTNADALDASDLPEGWARVRVGDISEVRLGRQRSPSRATGPNMRPYLRAANITWNGLDLSDVKEMDFSPAEQKVHRLKRGDVLLSEASGSVSEVGKPIVWNEEIEECYFQNTLIRVRSEDALPKYLYFHFLFDATTARFSEIAQGIGINHLGSNGLSNWLISLPPLAEQHHIVAKIESLFGQADAIERAVAIAQKRAEKVHQSILACAFRGEL